LSFLRQWLLTFASICPHDKRLDVCQSQRRPVEFSEQRNMRTVESFDQAAAKFATEM
jgi:hypothetical protein